MQKNLRYISGLEVDGVRAALWGREIGEGFDMRYLRWLRPLVVVASLVLCASGCDSAGQGTSSSGGGRATDTSTFEYATPPAVADSTATCIPTLPSITNTQVIDKPRVGDKPAVHMATLSGKAGCLEYGPDFWVATHSNDDYELSLQKKQAILVPMIVDNKGGWETDVPYDPAASEFVYIEGGSRCAKFMSQVPAGNVFFTLSGSKWLKDNDCIVAGRVPLKH